MTIRWAKESELDRVNELRKQVNDLHVAGKPDVFKAGFSQELQDYVYFVWNNSFRQIVVAEKDGVLCGYAVLHEVNREETPYMVARRYLDIDEFGVDQANQRQGVATAMVEFIRAYALEQGFHRIELNMWEFNQNALAFYEAYRHLHHSALSGL